MNSPIRLLLILFSFLFALAANGQSRPDVLYGNLQKSKPDTNRIKVLEELGVYYINLPDRKLKDIDSSLSLFDQGLKLAQQLKATDREMKLRSRLATANFIKGDDKKAMSLDLAVIDHYRQQKDLKQQAKYTAQLAFDLQPKSPEAITEKIRWYQESARLAALLHDQPMALNAARRIAELHISQGKPDLAEQELLEVITRSNAAGYKNLVPVYEQLASISFTRGDLNKQLDYQLKLIENMKATADTADAERHYRRLAENYFQNRMYEEAGKYGLLAMQAAKRNKKYVYAYSVLDLLNQVLNRQGKFKEALTLIQQTIREIKPVSYEQQIVAFESQALCYANLRQFDKAEKNIVSADSVYNIQNDDKNFGIRTRNYNDMMIHQLNMFSFYYRSRKYDQARSFILKADAIPKGTITASAKAVLERYHYKLDSAAGDFKSALLHAIRYKAINDSIFDVTKNKQLSDLHVKYETDKKEQAIKVLQAQEKQAVLERNIKQGDLDRVSLQRDLQKGLLSQAALRHQADSQKAVSEHNLQQAQVQKLTLQRKADLQKAGLEQTIQRTEIQKVNTQRNFTIVGIVALLVIAGLTYIGYRNKRKSNQVLQAQQKEINIQNETLQGLVVEKEWLLKEVHHRVKNNLQIIMSLLNSQSAYLENNDAKEAIRESQNRVQAISLLHQKLYRSSNLVTINLQNYIADLVFSLEHSFDTEQRRIWILQKIEPVTLDPAQAVPLGLILNESITNAIKYAFGPEGGLVNIEVTMTEKDDVLLTIADNGKGLPENFNLDDHSSLGMEMMKALSKQLEGEFKVCSNGGVQITIRFTDKQPGEYLQ